MRTDFADGTDQNGGDMGDKYLGALHDGEQFLCNTGNWGNTWTGFAMEVDAEGNLYVADSCSGQLHKFAPSYFDESGTFVMGEHMGWLGRCDGNLNGSNACDVTNGRSRGYSCRDDTCDTSAGTTGREPGQFAALSFIDLDPNNVLYAADSGRVQRFAVDGTYGGQARSTGTGINQGDRPGFILGNMGTVRNVTVNSTHFYVVDREESFVHVFETTPLKDITDESATVTYVSNFNFHGGVDTFTYSASDGLAASNTGTVRVQVDRNFRPPEAFAEVIETDEDTAVDLVLTGDDPDGVIGTNDVFPLDELTFRVVEQPAHGTLEVNGEQVRYTPDADYFGEDVFRFVANDGRFDSQPAVVEVTVQAVDDVPRLLQHQYPEVAGRGFPVLAVVDYWDDGGPSETDAIYVWGDGTDSENRGDYFDPDGPDGPEPARLDGVKIIEPPGGVGQGQYMADHIYTATGTFDNYTCFTTGNLDLPCLFGEIRVEDLVSISAAISDDPDETASNSIDLEIVVENTKPQSWRGLDATDVVLTHTAVAEARVSGIVAQSGGCTLTDGVFGCSDELMLPSEQIAATVRLTRNGSAPLIYDLGVPFSVEVSTTAPSVEERYTATRWATFLADPTDTDGDGMTDVFENAYGLDPNTARDAVLDADQDQLTNLEEYRRRTHPLRVDTEGDGVPDNEDFCPLDEGGSVVGLEGVCEQDLRASPVLRFLQMRQADGD